MDIVIVGRGRMSSLLSSSFPCPPCLPCTCPPCPWGSSLSSLPFLSSLSPLPSFSSFVSKHCKNLSIQCVEEDEQELLSDIIVIVVGGVKCQMGVSARPAYQHIVMLARLGAPRWTLARLCCQMLSVTCAPGVWNVASESPPKERWQNCGSLAKKVNKQKMKEKKQQQKFTGNRAALRTKSPFRPTISAPIMSEGQKNLLLIAVLMPNWQIQATIFCEFSFYRIKQWDKEKGGIKWGGGIPKGGLQQGAEHEVIVPARTNYGSKKV